jgi:RNA-binding protein
MALDAGERKALKRAAHHLKPVVRIGQYGLTDGVKAETDLCLDTHELIKVHIHEGKRDARAAMAAELAQACGAEVIHSIGKVFVLYRKRKANA